MSAKSEKSTKRSRLIRQRISMSNSEIERRAELETMRREWSGKQVPKKNWAGFANKLYKTIDDNGLEY